MSDTGKIIKVVSKYYEAISLTLLAVIRLLTYYFSGEFHMVPCLLLPMIVLKLHSVPVKYSVVFVHFATVNFLIGQPLEL